MRKAIWKEGLRVPFKMLDKEKLQGSLTSRNLFADDKNVGCQGSLPKLWKGRASPEWEGVPLSTTHLFVGHFEGDFIVF